MSFLKLFKVVVSKNIISTFGRFLVVGFLSMLVNLAALWLLKNAGLWQVLAAVLATEISIIHNFVWSERWTFKHGAAQATASVFARFLSFQLVTGLTSCLTLGLFLLFTSSFHIYYLLAQFLAIAVTTMVNFTVNSIFIWKLFNPLRRGLPELGFTQSGKQLEVAE